MKELVNCVSPDAILADTPDGTPVTVDFEELIGQHTLVAAQTGFGKSVLLRKIEELALAVGYPTIVIDSDGEMASLREAAPNGLLVAGGDHANPGITIEETVRRLPQIVAARASVVFDLQGIGNEQQASIVARILTIMMKLPKNLQQPYLVVIDEVQRFAAQHGGSKTSKVVFEVAGEGRSLGISLLVATQRVAHVSTNLTAHTRNKLFGRFSDAVDRKRIAEELRVSPREAARFAEFAPGDFLIRGKAFGGPLDMVRIRTPVTGKLGKDHMIEKLRLPIAPIEEVYALFGTKAADAGQPAQGAPASPAASQAGSAATALPQLAAFEADEVSLDLLLLCILAPHGRGGLHKDSLALLARSTERRAAFQDALSSLLARRLVSVGTGAKVRITADGLAIAAAEGSPVPTIEVLAKLRAEREAADERIVACLSAAGHVPIDAAEIRARTGLGPRVLKAALKRLKRDGWLVERRGSVVTSPALARLIGR